MKKIVYNRLIKAVAQPWFRMTRAMTLGVRVLVRNKEGGVLLVRHTYAPGWVFPGGGVETGETIYDAAAREVAEEAGIVVNERPNLFGFYSNAPNFAGDHVAFLIADDWTDGKATSKLEISESKFFAPGQLPAEATAGTLRRLDEVEGRSLIGTHW
ncbi:MAG: NUDIX domain-containing protein [Hyphomicrobiales bacterium]